MTIQKTNKDEESKDCDLSEVDDVLKNSSSWTTNFQADFYRKANAAPMLSIEEELSLFARSKDHGDLEAEASLMASYARLVLSIARQHLGYGLPLADMVQEGNVGLLKAIRRFDPTRGFRLGTMAMPWINAEMKEYALKNIRIVKIATTKGQKKLFYNLRSAKINVRSGDVHSTSGLTASEADRIAKMLRVKPEEVLEMEQRLSGRDCAYDTPFGEDEDGLSLIERLGDNTESPEESLDRRHREWLQHEGVRQALKGLDARSQRIVSARWIDVEDDGSGMTLHELASEFGLTAERIRQIEKSALNKMKAELSQYA